MPSRAVTSRFIAAALAFALAAGAVTPAYASVKGSDLVDGHPVSSSKTLEEHAPNITAPAGLLITRGGRVLWARQPDQRRAMASITKIMTALVVLDRADLSQVVTVTPAAVKVGESDAGIEEGDRLSVQQLLEAMLVKSANEAAMQLAITVGGSVPGFAAMMNAKAAQLGMKDSHFMNPHGLDQRGHYTSARDLGTLARAAMADARFRRIVQLRSIVLTGKNGRRTEKATDQILGRPPGLIGIKTGYTGDAGYSFVGAAQGWSGVELYSVILGTKTDSARFRQTERLLQWGFKHYYMTKLSSAGAPAGAVAVSDYIDRTVPAAVSAATTLVPVFDLAGPVERRLDVRSIVRAPVAKGQRLGMIEYLQGGAVLATAPVVATAAVPAPGPWEAFTIWLVRTWRGMTGATTVARSTPPRPLADLTDPPRVTY